MKVKDRIMWIIEHTRQKDVLDIGCVGIANPHGHREWLDGLIRRSAKFVFGIDNNIKGIRRLKKRGYNCAVADAENFSLPYKFDIVVASEIIEHLSNSGQFLDSVKRHLRRDGQLILTTPNAQYLYHLISSNSHSKDHVCTYTMQLLCQLLKRNGWDVIKKQYLNWGPPISSLERIYHALFLRIFPRHANTIGVIAFPSK
jgi:2-polyprenyl-3-methyl-5-hydroxy-6-metoxy-1,4-benzoquinol methylase